MLASIPDSLVGQAAGIATSMLWVATSIFFTAAGKRIGPTVVNTLRILMAVVLLGVTFRLMSGVWWPTVPTKQIWFLALSGIIGLSIGDQALFTSFIYIGPRLAILIMSTSPLWAVLFGWSALDERISLWAMVGILLTMLGVGWVVLERRRPTNQKNGQSNSIAPTDRPHLYLRGITLAFIGAVCQSLGLLLSKQGMGAGIESEGMLRIDAQPATLVRMTFAAAGVMPILITQQILRRRHARTSDPVRRSDDTHADPQPQMQPARWASGLAYTSAGAVAGPYLGVWMSLVAAKLVPVGIAQTLCSLSPIMILPVVAIGRLERVSLRAVIGAFVAVAGVTLLVLRG